MKLSKSLVLITLFVIGASFVCCDEDEDEKEKAGESAESDVIDNKDTTEDEPVEEGEVLVLTEENFDGVIKRNKVILVEFYAPWCGHCKSLAPELEAAAADLKEKDPPVVLAKVDATVHTQLAETYGVSGYPTLKFFIDGKVLDYDGPRQHQGIVDYMVERADPNWKPPPPAVIVLTTDNFAAVTEAEPLMLVEFFAPWCGHCKKLAPDFEAAAKHLAMSEPPVKLATVDATVETSLASKYEVTGYPTLKIFRNGKPSPFNGGRDVQGIIDYMEKQRGDGAVELTSLKTLQNSIKSDDVIVVGFFSDNESALYDAFVEVANDLREEFTFFYTFDKPSAAHYKLAKEAVVVFRATQYATKFETKFVVFDTAGASSADISTFIQAKQNPLVGRYGMGTSMRRYKDVRPIVLMFYTVDYSFDHRAATELWRLKLANIAREFPALTFAVSDEDEMGDLFQKFGFDESGEELHIGILGSVDVRFPMPAFEEFDDGEIRDFLTSFVDGNLKPTRKSQPLPKKKGPVTEVVGKTFDDIVLDPARNVLLVMYAPSCEKCKKIEPMYRNVARYYKSNDEIVVAKMDAINNDVPEKFSVDEYPFVFFKVAGSDDNPMRFHGGWTKDNLVRFVNKMAVLSEKDEL